MRFALEGDGRGTPRVVLDVDRRLPGRGAWLHPRRECLQIALKRKAFTRAFRKPVEVADLSVDDVE